MQKTTSSPMNNMPPPQALNPWKSPMFLEMIQGTALPVIVGSGPSSRTYVLPLTLLKTHSDYFSNEIARILPMMREAGANKKRKLDRSDTATELAHVDETDADEEGKKKEVDKAKGLELDRGEFFMRLPDVDPTIFGLFLRFMYQGEYPETVDAMSSTAAPNINNNMAPRTASGPISNPANPNTNTTSLPLRRPPSSQSNPAGSNSSSQPYTPIRPPTGTPTPTHLRPPPISTRSQPAMPPPPPPPSNPQVERIPPSIQAWLLAQRLGATHFMNYSITRIYSGIGVYFALTPYVFHHVWTCTVPPPSASNNTPNPNPLRTLLLDILVKHWANPNPHFPNAVLVRSQGPQQSSSSSSSAADFSMSLRARWESLFETHTDLRRDFIFGLQAGRGVGGVQAYFSAGAFAGRGGAGGGGVKRPGAGARPDGGVVVKKEGGNEEGGN
ncbi:hypothetical protein BDW02DRAFT_616691 [Decorospora gaudefroyi]|uniref:Uncharacterized protein n=1 Tax=Decorospora gaudefroyi TaxID=184978 RepID=A0A6A5KR90_9PLEO|nr:hypothetical protein BDW02DRAFT_616691 [Decorospora gaudefroyi]